MKSGIHNYVKDRRRKIYCYFCIYSGSPVLCRFGVTISIIFLSVGTVLLLIGFVVPPKKEVGRQLFLCYITVVILQ